MLVLNITALDLLSPYPVETFALTADLCDPVSDTSGCATAANDTASATSTACDPNNISDACLLANSPVDFSGTGGFADAPVGQTQSWINGTSFNNTPAVEPFTLPADPGLTCFQGIMYGPDQQYVTPEFAQQQVTVFCNAVANIPLDPIDTTQISEPYDPGYYNDTLLWVTKNWQLGDPTCTTGRTPSVSDCTKAFSDIMSTCDSSSPGRSFGGSLVLDCIDYMMIINGTVPNPLALTCQVS